MSLEADGGAYLSMREACEHLRYSRWTVRRLIRQGELTAVKGPARNARIRVDADSLAAYLARNRISPPAPQAPGEAVA